MSAAEPRARAKANGVAGPTVPAWQMPAGLRGVARVAADLLTEAERPTDFVIDRLAEAGDVILLKGAEKVTQKTWLAVHLAISIVTGREWLGFAVAKCKPRRVLFISTETRARVLVRRIIAACGDAIDPAVIAKYVVIVDEPVTFIPAAERTRAADKAAARLQLAALSIHDRDRRERVRDSADAAAEFAERNLGANVSLLDALATSDTWGLVIVDTLRQCLAGDENSSDDARRFIAAAREIARAAGCPMLVIHHTGKGGDASEARSSRGSTEITAGPDVVISLDASGAHPTAHFLSRNHESPPPTGYRITSDGEDVRLDVLPPCAGATKGMSEDDVIAVFRAHPTDGLTLTTLRKLVAKARGGKEGSKANAAAVQRHVDALVARGTISTCEIGEGMKGWRLGREGGRAPRVRLDTAPAGFDLDIGGPENV